jgi:hypothetical protein
VGCSGAERGARNRLDADHRDDQPGNLIGLANVLGIWRADGSLLLGYALPLATLAFLIHDHALVR